MSEAKKKFMEDNTRMMAELDEEALEKVNAFLTGVSVAVKSREKKTAGETLKEVKEAKEE